MRELLSGAGLEDSDSKDSADIYIINTCTVTREADRESKYIIGHLHKSNPKAKIVVTGCLSQKNASELSSLPGVTHVLKNSEKNNIAGIVCGNEIESALCGQKDLAISDFKGHSKAYVKIQDGCENRCSYCKVPLVREKLSSKPIADVSEEVSRLVQNGFREIILTGICLGAWGRELRSAGSLIDVLKAIDKIDGDFRIRLSSIEPKYVTHELVEIIAANRRFCPHLHIPFQSGDDDILMLMNRPYTSSKYRAIVDSVRSRIPRVSITTDILIGFPGESQARFDNSLNFIKAVSPSRTHIFTFSAREGTAAHDMPAAASHSELKKRYQAMNAVASEAADAYRRRFLEEKLNVLVENSPDKATGMLKGYSDNYIHVLFTGPEGLARKVVPVKVTGFNKEETIGVYVG